MVKNRSILGGLTAIVLSGNMSAQENNKQLLEDIQVSIQKQEDAVQVLAYTSQGQSNIGGDYAFKARVVYETKPNGRAHVWFSPLTTTWTRMEGGEPITTTVSSDKQIVYNGENGATLECRPIMGRSGKPITLFEGRLSANKAMDAYTDINNAGSSVTLWPLYFNGRHIRVSHRLGTINPENILRKGRLDFEVTLPGIENLTRPTTYTFRRHGNDFSIAKIVDVNGVSTTSYEVKQETYEMGIWFPTKIGITRESRQGNMVKTTNGEITITDVKVNPKLDDNTFYLVVPDNTIFSDDRTWDKEKGSDRIKINQNNPQFQNMVKLENDLTKPANPPSNPHPQRR